MLYTTIILFNILSDLNSKSNISEPAFVLFLLYYDCLVIFLCKSVANLTRENRIVKRYQNNSI